MDVSPGTKSAEQMLRFPNGVPAVADEDMTDWMEYVYEFTMPSVSASNFNLRLYFILWDDTYAWIDKMSLIKIE